MYYPVVSRISPQRRLMYQSVALLFISGVLAYGALQLFPEALHGRWHLRIGEQEYILRIGKPPVAIPVPPEATPVPQSSIVPANKREQFALDLLRAIGNPQPTDATIEMVVEWTLSEDDGDDAANRNNYLNTTLCGHNFVGAINADGACGVGHYGTYNDGLEAIVDTMTQSNFIDIVVALQQNDPELAKKTLWASAWASSHYGYGSAWAAKYTRKTTGVTQATSTPLVASGDYGRTVRIALDANHGAIRQFTLAPGATWSFGRSIAPFVTNDLPMVNGVRAGGWCNLAAMYIEVADQLGLASVVPPHYPSYGPRFPGVWLNEDGSGAMGDGSGDVTITNTTDHPIGFHVTVEGDTFTVSAGG